MLALGEKHGQRRPVRAEHAPAVAACLRGAFRPHVVVLRRCGSACVVMRASFMELRSAAERRRWRDLVA